MYEKFEFLLALEREKHFGRAAHVCGVSQPNLSAAIKQMEAQFGLVLVNRGARFIGFTPDGERVLGWARRMVGDFRALKAEIETMKQGQAGHLRIAAIPTALPVLSRLTAAYWERFPNVRVSISSCSSVQILELLENLEADIGITYLDNESISRNVEIPFYREHYCLVVSRNAPFADRPTVTWEEVAGLDLCLPSAAMQNRRIMDQIFAEVGLTVHPLLESNAVTVLVGHLRGGRLATVMPRIMTTALELQNEFITVPIVAPEVTKLIGLIHPNRDPMPPLTSAIISEARRLALAMID